MLTIWPLTVCTSVAHPTAQKGQTLGVTVASLMRSDCACATTGARLTPEAISPPSAVPPPPARDKRKTSRREISIATSGLSADFPDRQAVHVVLLPKPRLRQPRPACANAGWRPA